MAEYQLPSMQWPSIKFTQESINSEWPQISLLFVLFLLLIFNAVGLVEFGGSLNGFQLNPGAIVASDGTFSLPLVARSPEFLILTASSLLLVVMLPVLKPIPASFLVLVLTFAPFYRGLNIPYAANVIPMEYTLLVLLMLFGMNNLLKYFSETRKKQNIIDVFGQYIPPEVVDTLRTNNEEIDLSGDSRHMTVFFCDLKNFSGVSEKLSPKELVSLLNEYFTVMTEILFKHGATIDKYIGDSIMAFWGAPVAQKDHSRRAIMAAFEMHKAVNQLSVQYIAKGSPGPTMGVGINSGMMNVGNMGSKYRLAYTVIGDAVNLSSRLQDLTRIYQVPTIVGEATAKNIDDIVFKELDLVIVDGKKQPTRIYQPICMKSEISNEQEQMLERHQQALEIYYAKDYKNASDAFQKLLSESEQESYYKVMIEKVSHKIQGSHKQKC